MKIEFSEQRYCKVDSKGLSKRPGKIQTCTGFNMWLGYCLYATPLKAASLYKINIFFFIQHYNLQAIISPLAWWGCIRSTFIRQKFLIISHDRQPSISFTCITSLYSQILLNTDTSLLQTVCFVPGERNP